MAFTSAYISACTGLASPLFPPTATPTPLLIEAGGYFLPAPTVLDGYDVQVNGPQLGVLNPDKTLIISISGITAQPTNETPEEILDRYLTAVMTEGSGSYEKGPVSPLVIGEAPGVLAEITGVLYGFSFQGEAFVVPENAQHFLFGFGISNLSKDPANWETEGATVFHTLQNSLQFLKPEGCLVSADTTYGTLDNPIKVGGGPLDGPTRADVYLTTLRGPNGETLTYQNLGSTPSGDFDLFEVSGLAEPVTLVLDSYNFEPLRAPVGFTCSGAFPLVAP
ncbi:MAG: hypothetical protein HUU38_15510 [Anaerolineales bacterium]|nr:hypothetical protein [Anaerolineales bacterium]